MQAGEALETAKLAAMLRPEAEERLLTFVVRSLLQSHGSRLLER